MSSPVDLDDTKIRIIRRESGTSKRNICLALRCSAETNIWLLKRTPGETRERQPQLWIARNEINQSRNCIRALLNMQVVLAVPHTASTQETACREASRRGQVTQIESRGQPPI